MTNTNNDIEELEELLTELEGQEAQLVSPYSEDDDAVTQLMDAPLGDQDWMVQVTALDRRMMSTEQLLNEIRSGKVTGRTLVWRGGMEDWLPVARVDELARASRPASSPVAMSVPFAGGASATMSSPASLPLAPPPSMAPRSAVSLPPPPAPVPPPAPAVWASTSGLGQVPLPPPAAPVEAVGSATSLPKEAELPPPAALESPRSTGSNTTRPVAVDFSELEPEPASSSLGKRALLGLAAAAILAGVVATIWGSGGDEKPVAKNESAAPRAVAALQPVAAPPKVAPAPTPAVEAPAPAPAPAAAAAPESPESEDSESASATGSRTAPARYSMRSEYRRRSKSSSARSSSSSNEREPAEEEEKASAEPAEPPSSAAPSAEEPSSSVAADDDADAEQAPKSGKSGDTFNRDAAKTALEQAALQAKNCRPQGGPSGSGRVQVKYEPSGKVASVSILTSKFENTDTGMCVRMVFRRARVPEFTGAQFKVVNKSFEIP